MTSILTWTLDTIREEDSSFSWMEECRYDWVPVVQNAVSKIIDGQTILLLTDEKQSWYAKYVASKINNLQNERPFLPVYTLRSMFHNLNKMKNTQELDLLEDMLEISYPNGYFIWYIGSAESSYSKFAFRNDENLLWIIDGDVPNSFYLKNAGASLDIKLIQLFKLFNKTIDASLFGDINLD
ncbi:MAG: DNA replication regulator family [uncultured Sulfurovum sp.]|uniref:DNA replication regulator family n=1 Tax=uncultured Sulfurovum sp. TaxID=269237 RepID=A0A6S6TPK6_9BACT|nr:MAG: DNA replication regulator family [uncultured Sulfurovum sp.]